MFNIEYSIKLNEYGRPYINLPEDREDRSEDRFFCLELTRYVLNSVFSRRSEELDEITIENLKIAITVLEDIGDEMAGILYNQMASLGEVQFVLKNNYHIQVKTIEERNNLPQNNILIDNKIYHRQEDLKVLVTDEMKIYKLTDGIDNLNWKEVE